jgi:long-chain acyl-CoA synthetase
MLAELFPAAELVEFYGTSETSFITLARADAPPGSVGRPYPNVELEIIRSVGTPDCGEVRVSSPYLAQAYLGPPVKQISQPNGFVLTGEIGCQDANGFLFIKGRADRMITISDVNVYPEAIEGAVAAMESVGACAVVAIADNLRGNRTICFVEPASEKLNPSAVRRHCRETLDEHHVPKRVLPIERIPTLPSGKPDLQTLQKMALVQV